MTNSLVHSLEGCVTNVFEDVKWTYGSVREWERDKTRSLHELVNRGLRMQTIDLPAVRKHFEQCLENGLYTPSNLYLSGKGKKGVQVPAYLRDLYLQVFSSDGKLRDEPSVQAITDIRQIYELLGKLKNTCEQEVIDNEAKAFIAVERELRQPNLGWTNDVLFVDGRSNRSQSFEDLHPLSDEPTFGGEFERITPSINKREALTLQRVCDILSTQFGDLHDEDSGELPQHGTGRVSNLAKSESKFDFSCWPAKLDHVFPYDRYAGSDFSASSYLEYAGPDYLNHEAPSKLIAVPKTMSGPRLIASEPNYHQWIQQLVRNQLERRITRTDLDHCVSFGAQESNRRMALTSSIDRSLATVDLKSASDRLSCWTVERALRANITMLERIHACRTRTMTNHVSKYHFQTIVLKKCFTQGSACTFPVQTILYSMFAIASDLIARGDAVTRSNIISSAKRVRVFGDDIIVPTTTLPKLNEILEFLQLKVNLSKTFSKGNFRESCGLDAYNGVEVTPARIKRFSVNPSHEVAMSMLESANNLFMRGMWHTANWLMSHLDRYDFAITPITHGSTRDGVLHDSGGIASFCGASVEHLRKRFNKELHRTEYKYHALTSKSKVVPTQSAHDLVQFLYKGAKRSKSAVRPLDYLAPRVGDDIGIVNKKSSVMNSRWRAPYDLDDSSLRTIY
jgi:hypothetical protein